MEPDGESFYSQNGLPGPCQVPWWEGTNRSTANKSRPQRRNGTRAVGLPYCLILGPPTFTTKACLWLILCRKPTSKSRKAIFVRSFGWWIPSSVASELLNQSRGPLLFRNPNRRGTWNPRPQVQTCRLRGTGTCPASPAPVVGRIRRAVPRSGSKEQRVASKLPNRCGSNMNPGEWKHRQKPAVPWWFTFDPYPNHPSDITARETCYYLA